MSESTGEFDTASNANAAQLPVQVVETAYQGAVAITPGTAITAGRAVGFVCTVAGNVTLTLADGSTITLPITTAGGAFQVLPFAVTNITLGSGTAGSFWGLR